MKLTVAVDPERIMSRRGLGEELNRFIASEVVTRCDRRVPCKTGRLKSSAKIAENGGSVSYNTPYARYQYYGISKSGAALNYNGAPLRGSYWDKNMLIDESEEICSRVREYIGEK